MEFIAQGADADAQHLGRMGAIIVSFLKGLHDHLTLNIPETRHDAAFLPIWWDCMWFGGRII